VIFIGKKIIGLEEPDADYLKSLRSDFGFVLGLVQDYPLKDQAKLYTRLITIPCYTKELFEPLLESIKQFE
jgi:hypothetical protein